MRNSIWPRLFLLCGCVWAQPAPEPLTGNERAQLWATQSFWSPGVFFNAVVPATTGQIANDPREWGQGSAGFARRAASSFGRNVLQQGYKDGIAAALSHETRYVRAGQKGFLARLSNALTSDFVTYNAAGERVANVANLGGTIGSEFTADLWMPDRYRTASRTMRRAGFVIAFDSAFQIFQEFSPELRRLNPFRKQP